MQNTMTNLTDQQKRWIRRGIWTMLGGLGGYAYYYFIGCYSGACPLTSNPYISTMYGALVGILIGGNSKPKPSPNDTAG